MTPSFVYIGIGGTFEIAPAQPTDLVRDLTITNTRGQYQVIQTRYNDPQPQQIDPSFYENNVKPTQTKEPTPYLATTVGVGLTLGPGNEAGGSGFESDRGQFGLVRGSVEDDTSTSIDYQGWYTEGDSIEPPKPTTSTSRFYTGNLILIKSGSKGALSFF